MYDVPEPRYWLEPPTPDTVGYCSECGQDIYAGEDVWEIKGELYCEYCMDSFKKEAENESENCFEDVV